MSTEKSDWGFSVTLPTDEHGECLRLLTSFHLLKIVTRPFCRERYSESILAFGVARDF